LSMEERVELLDGKLEIQTSPGRGCRVLASLPLPPAPPSAEIEAEESHP
jgi:hypothetical protein